MSDPDRPLPWAEMLLSLPLIAFVAYAAGVREFPWGVLLVVWALGAGIGFHFARSYGFRPFVGILAGMLVCFPVNLLFFMIDPRKPRPEPASPDWPGLAPVEPAGSPVEPSRSGPGRGLAKASALLGVGGFLCWGLCMPRLVRAGWDAERIIGVGWPLGIVCLAANLWLGPSAAATAWSAWRHHLPDAPPPPKDPPPNDPPPKPPPPPNPPPPEDHHGPPPRRCVPP